jgi:hypothetical protein
VRIDRSWSMSAMVIFRQLAGESRLCGTESHSHFRALQCYIAIAKAFSDFHQLHWILFGRVFSLNSSSRIARRRSHLNSLLLTSERARRSFNRYNSLSC